MSFNLSNGNGFSVREVIETACRITGRVIKAGECALRPSDPLVLLGSSSLAIKNFRIESESLRFVANYPACLEVASKTA